VPARGEQERAQARHLRDDLPRHISDRYRCRARVLCDGSRDRDGILSDPFPLKRGDLARALAGENEKLHDGAVRVADLLCPLPNLRKLTIGQHAVAWFLRRLPDPDARRRFEIPGDAPVEECADVFEGVRALAWSFDRVERFGDLVVCDLVDRLRPVEMPREVSLELVCGARAEVGDVLLLELLESDGEGW
jgi:hypothetical protein